MTFVTKQWHDREIKILTTIPGCAGRDCVHAVPASNVWATRDRFTGYTMTFVEIGDDCNNPDYAKERHDYIETQNALYDDACASTAYSRRGRTVLHQKWMAAVDCWECPLYQPANRQDYT